MGGKRYEIEDNILLKIPYFKAIIQINNNKDNSIPIYVNRSAISFDHVLSYTMDANYPFPLEFMKELTYYEIKFDQDKLYNKNKEVLEYLHYISNFVQNEQHTHASISCRVYNCKNQADVGKLYCDDHKRINKCIVTDYCTNGIKGNYCSYHLTLATRCDYKNCCCLKITGQTYCYKHNKK